MAEVRTRFQPRHKLEVSDQEAEVLKAQGLLWEGTDADLAALLASDPTGPLDPRPVAVVSQQADAVPAPVKAAAADKAPADTAKGA